MSELPTANEQPNFQDRIRLDSIISIVDCEQIFAYPEYPGIQEHKLRQIGFSDMVMLNKIDLVDEEQLQEVKDWINNRMNRVRMVESVQCNVPLEILLSVGRFEPSQLAEPGESQHRKAVDHGQAFSTWSFQTSEPLSLEALKEMVKRELPASIYRCKGVVYAAENPEQRAVLQVVGRRSDISLGETWDGDQPLTQIVAIGAPGGIDPEDLRAKFEACIVKLETPVAE